LVSEEAQDNALSDGISGGRHTSPRQPTGQEEVLTGEEAWMGYGPQAMILFFGFLLSFGANLFFCPFGVCELSKLQVCELEPTLGKNLLRL
jgi:hypothetical protein